MSRARAAMLRRSSPFPAEFLFGQRRDDVTWTPINREMRPTAPMSRAPARMPRRAHDVTRTSRPMRRLRGNGGGRGTGACVSGWLTFSSNRTSGPVSDIFLLVSGQDSAAYRNLRKTEIQTRLTFDLEGPVLTVVMTATLKMVLQSCKPKTLSCILDAAVCQQ